mmetsp:Transcript_9999/g.29098  ORF Transcript_9999/g.29098 Transcript_9999/m.29098 type:complete len:345 (+) Transcript_9999:340-1374(+)|eukprot:scaffold152942_cov31-Tisochrysis_lutea.AAC.1
MSSTVSPPAWLKCFLLPSRGALVAQKQDAARALAERELLAKELRALEEQHVGAPPPFVYDKTAAQSMVLASQCSSAGDSIVKSTDQMVRGSHSGRKKPVRIASPRKSLASRIPKPPMPPSTWVKKSAPLALDIELGDATLAQTEEGFRRHPSLDADVSSHQYALDDAQGPALAESGLSPQPRHESHLFRRMPSKLVPEAQRGGNATDATDESMVWSPRLRSNRHMVSTQGLDQGGQSAPNHSDLQPIPLDERPLKPPPVSPGRALRVVRRRAGALATLNNQLSDWQVNQCFDSDTDRILSSTVEEERMAWSQENSSGGEHSPVKMPTPFRPRLKLGRSPPISYR